MQPHPAAARALLAALLLLGAGAASAAEPGRLFFTPGQRADLDRQRLAGVTPQAVAEPPETLTVQGLVRRNGRRDTLFVNGAALDPRQAAALDLMPLPGNTGAVGFVPESGEGRRLPIGTSTADPASGETRSSLGDGGIRIHARPR